MHLLHRPRLTYVRPQRRGRQRSVAGRRKKTLRKRGKEKLRTPQPQVWREEPAVGSAGNARSMGGLRVAWRKRGPA